MKPSEMLDLFIENNHDVLPIHKTVGLWGIQSKVAQLEKIVQAAVDYFEDGITNKEQYAAYKRFVSAVQPWFEAEG